MSRASANPGRREWLAVGALMGFAFALRVWFVLAMEAHPPHQVPILDSAFHVDWARALAAGREYAPLADRPFFRAPLYAWFLAGLFTLLLLASSGTIQLGVRALEAGDRERFRRWLVVTMVLAGLFLAAFVVIERTVKDPLIRLSLFRSRSLVPKAPTRLRRPSHLTAIPTT